MHFLRSVGFPRIFVSESEATLHSLLYLTLIHIQKRRHIKKTIRLGFEDTVTIKVKHQFGEVFYTRMATLQDSCNSNGTTQIVYVVWSIQSGDRPLQTLYR